MFKELFELWRKDNLMTQAFDATFVMLETSHKMFKETVKSLRSSDKGELDMDAIYAEDRKINKFEQEVRGKVLKHLAITGNVNVVPGLILVSIVIDLERIGDYTKNIMDLAQAHPKILHCGKFEADVRAIESSASDAFERISKIMEKSDVNGAKNLIETNYDAKKKCDAIVKDMIQNPDTSLSASTSITAALYVRYLKRILSHLMNTASSVVNPFEKIGYYVKETEIELG